MDEKQLNNIDVVLNILTTKHNNHLEQIKILSDDEFNLNNQTIYYLMNLKGE